MRKDKRRVVKACDSCRVKKTRCDGGSPCQRCRASDQLCTFSQRKRQAERTFTTGYVEMLEVKLNRVVAGFMQLVAEIEQGRDCSKFVSGPDTSINTVIGLLSEFGKPLGEEDLLYELKHEQGLPSPPSTEPQDAHHVPNWSYEGLAEPEEPEREHEAHQEDQSEQAEQADQEDQADQSGQADQAEPLVMQVPGQQGRPDEKVVRWLKEVYPYAKSRRNKRISHTGPLKVAPHAARHFPTLDSDDAHESIESYDAGCSGSPYEADAQSDRPVLLDFVPADPLEGPKEDAGCQPLDVSFAWYNALERNENLDHPPTISYVDDCDFVFGHSVDAE